MRDRDGRILWAGKLAQGQRQQVIGLAPFDVTASNGTAVHVSLPRPVEGHGGSHERGGQQAVRLTRRGRESVAGAERVRHTSGRPMNPSDAASAPSQDLAPPTTVAMVTLGCARNEVDSEELAGRLEAGGFRLVADPADAETVVVNTCGFVEAAKKDSVDTLLAAADLKASAGQGGHAQSVVAVGCLAERYGAELATSLPEADAVLGFDDYPDIAERLRSILAGEQHHPHTPQDRRRLLPISPAERTDAAAYQPGHAPQTRRTRLGDRADGPAEARLRLRPALHLLRDPGLPRLLRLPPPLRRARRGALAGRGRRAGAVPGQRELHLLRQGPR